ncbi:MAG: hypothetical protein MJY61_00465 [Bacteroidales bacterium]|nr:hypothetical protein [Bacteroidales bacterium]
MKTESTSILRAGAAVALAFGIAGCGPGQEATSYEGPEVKTTFQTSQGWRPTLDIRADGVMVYSVTGNPPDSDGAGDGFEDKVKSWRDRGYVVQYMTGIAWGSYQDYFTGKWDGRRHMDEGQVDAQGDTIWHGPLVPYIVPTENYLRYIKEEHVRRVIDNGITELFFEEPEFWAKSGYSDAFKAEWKKFYGFDWRPQHETPENTYLSNKLKYRMYYRAIDEVCTYAKEYGRSKGLDVRCYVATHSLLNYSQWQIVSPEASLASLPCVDGYIAQVWTGTSRQRNFYNGVEKERTFETAYLEYGCMESMTAPTGRKMYCLTDPIEDGDKDWLDYKLNYQRTFTAKLLYPGVANYEVMPWPERIYEGLYRVSLDSDERTTIPRHYSTQVQLMTNALNRMPLSDNKVSGTQGITVLMANSLMFQGFPEHQGCEDPRMSNFYGQTLPLIKAGIPVRTAHLENLGFKESLAQTRVLILSYSNMKPMEAKPHKYIADWVKKGGILVYTGRDDDPFQTVCEWWNRKGNSFAAPSDHLFKLMGIPEGAAEGTYAYGKGTVCVLRHDPREYVLTEGGADEYVDKIAELYPGTVEFKNHFYLERGMFDIAAVLDESVSGEPLRIEGRLIDVYDNTLPVCSVKELSPGQQCLLIDVNRVEDPSVPRVLAAAAREYDEKVTDNSYSFVCKSPVRTTNVARILLPVRPRSVKIAGEEVFDESEWDEFTHTYRITHENNPDGVTVEFEW